MRRIESNPIKIEVDTTVQQPPLPADFLGQFRSGDLSFFHEVEKCATTANKQQAGIGMEFATIESAVPPSKTETQREVSAKVESVTATPAREDLRPPTTAYKGDTVTPGRHISTLTMESPPSADRELQSPKDDTRED